MATPIPFGEQFDDGAVAAPAQGWHGTMPAAAATPFRFPELDGRPAAPAESAAGPDHQRARSRAGGRCGAPRGRCRGRSGRPSRADRKPRAAPGRRSRGDRGALTATAGARARRSRRGPQPVANRSGASPGAGPARACARSPWPTSRRCCAASYSGLTASRGSRSALPPDLVAAGTTVLTRVAAGAGYQGESRSCRRQALGDGDARVRWRPGRPSATSPDRGRGRALVEAWLPNRDEPWRPRRPPARASAQRGKRRHERRQRCLLHLSAADSADPADAEPRPSRGLRRDAAKADDLGAVFDIPVQLSAVLGKASMSVTQLLHLGRGAVLELDRKVGEAIDIYGQQPPGRPRRDRDRRRPAGRDHDRNHQGRAMSGPEASGRTEAVTCGFWSSGKSAARSRPPSKMAVQRGAEVRHVGDPRRRSTRLRAGQGADLLLVDVARRHRRPDRRARDRAHPRAGGGLRRRTPTRAPRRRRSGPGPRSSCRCRRKPS